jgi:hypothetical protein
MTAEYFVSTRHREHEMLGREKRLPMTLDDVPEMVENWQSGSLRLQDVYFLCLDLFEYHEIDAVLPRLPSNLREEVDSRLRADWDNDTPAEECIIFHSGRGEHPATKTILERAR